MALKTDKVFTVSTEIKGVVVWDTTLRPLCKKFKSYDPEARSYMTIYGELREKDKYTFTTKSGITYIVQRNRRADK